MTQDDHAALYWACRNGHKNAVEALLAAGSDMNARNGLMLDVAAAFGHVRVLEFLLQKGMTVPDDGGLALKWARQNGQEETAAVLEKHIAAQKAARTDAPSGPAADSPAGNVPPPPPRAGGFAPGR